MMQLIEIVIKVIFLRSASAAARVLASDQQ